jgi:hypothetical protein
LETDCRDKLKHIGHWITLSDIGSLVALAVLNHDVEILKQVDVL